MFGSSSIVPVLGYVMIVRDCEESRSSGGKPIRSPHFPIDPKFMNASYLERFRILCERLRRKNLYYAVWLVFADPEKGCVYEPDPSMTYEMFIETIKSGLALHRCLRRSKDGCSEN